jgi:hypothetical protein
VREAAAPGNRVVEKDFRETVPGNFGAEVELARGIAEERTDASREAALGYREDLTNPREATRPTIIVDYSSLDPLRTKQAGPLILRHRWSGQTSTSGRASF